MSLGVGTWLRRMGSKPDTHVEPLTIQFELWLTV